MHEQALATPLVKTETKHNGFQSKLVKKTVKKTF